MSPVWEGNTPCWEARCDECGKGDGHFDTREEMVQVLEAAGWLIEGDLCECPDCLGTWFDSLRNLRTAWIN